MKSVVFENGVKSCPCTGEIPECLWTEKGEIIPLSCNIHELKSFQKRSRTPLKRL